MKYVSFCLTTLVCLFSCTSPRYVYGPASQNVPSLENKNDAELSVNYGSSLRLIPIDGEYNRGLDLQSAWAPADHVGLMLNYTNRWEKDRRNLSIIVLDSMLVSYNRSFIETAAGYFTSIDPSRKIQFQVFGGGAFGHSNIKDENLSDTSTYRRFHNSKVTKLFIQPAVIFKPTENFNAGLSMRFTEVLFNKISTNYNTSELDKYLLDSLASQPVFFWEPAVIYTFGFKDFPLKFRVQGSISVLLNRRFVDHRSGNASLGVVWNIRGKGKAVADSTR